MNSRALSCAFALALVAACAAPTPSDPCGGACAASEFCCLGRCAALGSVCGGNDGGALDATPAPDASVAQDAGSDAGPSDPCALHGGATSVASACEASDPALVAAGYPGPAVRSCASAGGTWCGAMGNCVEWLDSTSTLHGVCASAGLTSGDVCDPAHDTYACVGTVERVCVADLGGEPGDSPPGWWGASDCRARWADDATCMVYPDGVARCTSPTDVPCDPTTSVDHCNARCMEAPGTSMGGVVRPICSGDRPFCVDNASTAGHPGCLPAGATPSTLTPTSDVVSLSCADATSIHQELYGYEYTVACAPALEIGPSGVAMMVPTHCWAAPDGSTAICITDSVVPCSSESTPPACVDAMHSSHCTGWLPSTETCSAPLRGPCDSTTGQCTSAPPCHPGWPFTETCAGADQKWVIGSCASGYATLAPCTGCAPNATGDGVTCG